jgi:hypothetical protein
MLPILATRRGEVSSVDVWERDSHDRRTALGIMLDFDRDQPPTKTPQLAQIIEVRSDHLVPVGPVDCWATRTSSANPAFVLGFESLRAHRKA